MVYTPQEEDFYTVCLRLNAADPKSLDNALALPYLHNVDPMPDQQTAPFLYTAYFEHNPEGYGEYDPTAEIDGTHFRQDDGLTSLDTQLYEQTQTISYALPIETSSDWSSSPSGTLQQMGTSPLNVITFSTNPPGEHSEGYDEYDLGVPTVYDGTAASSAEIDGTNFSHDYDPTGTTLDTHSRKQPQSVPYSPPVEASRHWSSSSSGHLQQVDTPSLNDNTFSMDTSGDNMTLDSDSEEESDEDDVPTLGDHGPTNKCGLCGRGFHAPKAVTRHFDDVHSEPKQCPEPGCQKMIIGKRKRVTHLERDHGHARKPGRKQQQIPNDAPLQSTSTQASSHQVQYWPDFGPHEGGWASRNEVFGPS